MQIIQKHHKIMFEIIENYENKNQNHDLKFHIIISFIIKIMHDHIFSHCEAFHTDVLTVTHHAEITVRMNDQIKEVVVLFNKKHVSFIIFFDNLLKQ